MNRHHQLSDCRGVAAVIALLVMVVLSILGLSFLGYSLTESQIGSNESDLRKAFFAAEAGIQEAMYRMRVDRATFTDEADTPCSSTADPVVVGRQGTPGPSWADPTNANFWYYNPFTSPTACPAWSYTPDPTNNPKGNFFGAFQGTPPLNTAGRTFMSSGSAHGVGGKLVNSNITNTASDPRSYTVTVAPVVGYVGGCWQYVDQFGTALRDCLKVAPNPLYRVTSTGTAKNAQKVLSTIIRRFSINPKPDGTVTANTNIDVKSAAAVIDGRNYDCEGNNPSDTGSLVSATTPTGGAGISINKPENLVCTAGTGITNCGGTSSTFPNSIAALLLGPSASPQEIAALDAYLESIKVTPENAPDKAGAPFNGILYVDGNYPMPPENSTGILIVHHRDNTGKDVANLGNFNGGTFKGLIIADSLNKTNGNAQIVGAIFGFGNTGDGVVVDDVAGTPSIKYSSCILDGLNQNFPFRIIPGTWHEE